MIVLECLHHGRKVWLFRRDLTLDRLLTELDAKGFRYEVSLIPGDNRIVTIQSRAM